MFSSNRICPILCSHGRIAEDLSLQGYIRGLKFSHYSSWYNRQQWHGRSNITYTL